MSKFIVIGIHGLGGRAAWLARIQEEFERYNQSQNEHSFSLVAKDLKGFGEGGSGHIDSFHDWLKDIQNDYDQIAQNNPDARIVIFGHSLGGLIATNLYGIRASDTLVLSVPGFKGAASTFKPLFVAKTIFTYIFNKSKLINLPCPKDNRQGMIRGKLYIGDPSDQDPFKTSRVSANLLWQILELGKHSKRNLSRLKTNPLVLIQVEGDTVVDNASQDELLKLSPSPHKHKITVHSDLHDWPIYDLVETTIKDLIEILIAR